MGYWLNKLDSITEQKKGVDNQLTLEEIPGITLSEFARRDMAVEIFSEFLQCNIWLCSNDGMAAQIMKDAPGSFCYTVDELRHLISLDPGPESLRKIHEAKIMNPGSIIKKSVPKIDTGLPEELHE